MQVLKDLRDDLPLGRRVLFPHGSVHELGYVSVEVRDEMLQVLLVRHFVGVPKKKKVRDKVRLTQ